MKLWGQTVETPGTQSLAPLSAVSTLTPAGPSRLLSLNTTPCPGLLRVCLQLRPLCWALTPPPAAHCVSPGHSVHVFSSLGLKVSLSPLAAAYSVGDHVCFFFSFSYPTFSQTEIHCWLFLRICPESPCSLYLLWLLPAPVLFVWVTLRPSDSFGLCAPFPSSQCSSWSNALTMSLKSCYSFAQKPSNGSVPMK